MCFIILCMMKIAIVGKWGSGKSTISSLILAYLTHKSKKFWAIDADTNMHLWLNFHIQYEADKALSNENNAREIKKYLIWKNKLIDSVDHMVKTTPPWPWSTILKNTHDEFIKKYSIWHVWGWELFYVWWYTPEWAGISCYHTNLAILENLLAHINFSDEYLVVDMVASTDTFAGPMYTQFDKIILLVEPTKESIDLAQKYREITKTLKTDSQIQFFGNKIVDHEDLEFIEKSFWIKQFPYLKMDNNLKKHLRNDMSILSYFDDNSWYVSEAFSFIEEIKKVPFRVKTQNLAKIHRKVAKLDYIKIPLGDLTHQIDEDFINTL